MKRIGSQKKARPFSLSATACFLLLAAGLVCGCIMIVGSMLGRQAAQLPAPEASPQPSLAPPAEDSSEAAAMLVPEDGRLPSPSPAPPAGTVPPDRASSPAPTPTPMPAIGAAPFSEERMDFVVLGFDDDQRADALCIVSLRDTGCTVLSLPRNTLCAGSRTLGDAGSAAQAFIAMRQVFPVYLHYYIRLDMSGLADCVDAFGGVSLGGEHRTGREATVYLEAGGSDELLRITRQQALLHALIERLQQLGLLRLLSAKYTLQKHTGGNLSANQYIELYGALRRLDADDIRFLSLPVDSVIHNEQRYYRPDRALCETLAGEIFGDGGN